MVFLGFLDAQRFAMQARSERTVCSPRRRSAGLVKLDPKGVCHLRRSNRRTAASIDKSVDLYLSG
jgi:hypothetical protein